MASPKAVLYRYIQKLNKRIRDLKKERARLMQRIPVKDIIESPCVKCTTAWHAGRGCDCTATCERYKRWKFVQIDCETCLYATVDGECNGECLLEMKG